MANDDIDFFLAFPAILLRETPVGRHAALSRGIFISTAHATGAMLVNGVEVHPTHGSQSLLAGVYYPRLRLASNEEASAAPAPGDLIGIKVREGLVAAYGVLAAGPAPNPDTEGALPSDGVVCELRQDLGSIHSLTVQLDDGGQLRLH